MAISQKLVTNLFPKVEFAFFGNYINRYKRQVMRKVGTQSLSFKVERPFILTLSPLSNFLLATPID